MKRSEINQAIKDMEDLIVRCHFQLPPFCRWKAEDWQDKNEEYNEIRDNGLGWDITDFGLGDFQKVGFSLITLRNGNQKDDRYKKPYAEKLLMLYSGQSAPMHFHWYKMEDIINRGGGEVLIQVYNSSPEGEKLETEVTIYSDGRCYKVPAGHKVCLKPGESITIQPYLYHSFEVKEGKGPVLLGEVSMANDDANDNRFYDPIGRFPAIEEDEEPWRLLCTEYPPASVDF
ncbi:MAG: D-lyxose/D-mannose family sugar isomerase [Peptoniphilaceae bacterium]|nr:D-lyxose/D-mannose family sugar isomerase [Peptoniphilaceae bacterium]